MRIVNIRNGANALSWRGGTGQVAAMAKPLPSADPDLVVSTSDFVRQFGRWQERAVREPVYILHRGRPRFVLTSVEMMQRLCAAQEAGPDLTEKLDDAALLDLVEEIVLIIDHDLRLVQSSAAARRYFGIAPDYAASMLPLVDRTGQALLDQAMRRVITTGLGETIELAAPYPARQLSFEMMPHPIGLAAVARDITVIDELRIERAQRIAEQAAIVAVGGMAVLRLNIRGYIEGAAAGLAVFAGMDEGAIAGARFTSLIGRGTRIAVGDAIERVLGDGTTLAIDADLLVGGQQEQAVRIGIAPIRAGSPIEGVAIVITAATTPD